MNIEQTPQSNQPEKEKFPETYFGEESVFEIDPETGGLKRAAEEKEKPAEKKVEKKEVPANVIEDAEEYAKMMAHIARDPKEADRIKKESYQKFLKEKGY